jgi:hypothetical protein
MADPSHILLAMADHFAMFLACSWWFVCYFVRNQVCIYIYTVIFIYIYIICIHLRCYDFLMPASSCSVGLVSASFLMSFSISQHGGITRWLVQCLDSPDHDRKGDGLVRWGVAMARLTGFRYVELMILHDLWWLNRKNGIGHLSTGAGFFPSVFHGCSVGLR